MGRGARLFPPPSGAPSITTACPLPVSARKLIPPPPVHRTLHRIFRISATGAPLRPVPGLCLISANRSGPALAPAGGPGCAGSLVALRHRAAWRSHVVEGIALKDLLLAAAGGLWFSGCTVTNFLQCTIEPRYPDGDGRRGAAEPSLLHLLQWWIRPGPTRSGPFCFALTAAGLAGYNGRLYKAPDRRVPVAPDGRGAPFAPNPGIEQPAS